jgi:hypothetical protein
MKMSTRSLVAVILVCGFTVLTLAQAAPELPKPGPEHKKMEYFLGTWRVENEIKANAYVPASKGITMATFTSGPGGFFLEFNEEGQIPPTHGIIAYDSVAKGYTEFYASSTGLVGTASGTADGTTWTWIIEDKWFGRAVKGRTTITIKSASQFTSKYEMLDPSGSWVTISEGIATKVAP